MTTQMTKRCSSPAWLHNDGNPQTIGRYHQLTKGEGEGGMPDFKPGDLMFASLASIWFCMDPVMITLKITREEDRWLTCTTHCWTQKRGHRIGPRHVLKDRNEEPNLYLGWMLKKTVKSGCALCFGKNLKPYFKRKRQNEKENNHIRHKSHIAQWQWVLLWNWHPGRQQPYPPIETVKFTKRSLIKIHHTKVAS